jgi:predicted GNAT family acetyltransferase
MIESSAHSATDSLLANLVWKSLSGVHRTLGEVNGRAMRYQPDVAPFAALEEQNPDCVEDLARLMKTGEEACLIDQEASNPKLFDEVSQSDAAQMLYHATHQAAFSSDDIQLLSQVDLPSMEALIASVFPGYFRHRTNEMGRYYGIFIQGQLAAMAGERLSVPGMREISSICTHATHQGQGLAARLTQFLIREIRSDGNVPFLHVGLQNTKARRLYSKLGFNEGHIARIKVYRRKS